VTIVLDPSSGTFHVTKPLRCGRCGRFIGKGQRVGLVHQTGRIVHFNRRWCALIRGKA